MLRVAEGVPLSSGPAIGPWHFALADAVPGRYRLIRQDGDFLCWAACAAMVDAAQPQPQGVSQCEIAATALNRDCCGGAKTSSACDEARDQVEITNVLNAYCPTAEPILYYLDESELEDEIFGVGGAVQVRWQWSTPGPVDAHVVLVVGGQFEPGRKTVYSVLDPMFPSPRPLTYEELLDAGGKGRWAESWIGL